MADNEKVLVLGQYWGYNDELCKGCPHLERGGDLVACNAPGGKCVKNDRQIYKDWAYNG